MPLNTKIIRDNETLHLPNGWGGFHVVAMTLAATYDSHKGPFLDNTEPPYTTRDIKGNPIPPGHYITSADTFRLMSYEVIGATPLNDGVYTIKKKDYTFIDAQDGEVLTLRVGDELHAWRSYK